MQWFGLAGCPRVAARGAMTRIQGKCHLSKLLRRTCRYASFWQNSTKWPLAIPRRIDVLMQQCYSHDVPKSRLFQADHLTNQILNAKLVDNVLLAISNSTVQLESNHLAVAILKLDQLIYEEAARLPCAYYNNDMMLSVQCFTNSEMKELFKPVLRCPEFEELCLAVARNATNFSDVELVTTLLSLVRLHVHSAHESVSSLTIESLNRQDGFGLESLAIYSEVGNLMKRAGFYVNCQIARIFQKRVEMGFEMEDLRFVSRILANVGYFFTNDFLTGIENPLTEIFKDNPVAIEPSWVVNALEPLARFSDLGETGTLSEDFLKPLMMRLDELKVWQLPKVLIYMNMFKSQNEELKKAILWQGRKYLAQCPSPRLVDIVSLLAVCDLCDGPDSFLIQLQNLLQAHICDADVIVLKALAQNASVLNSHEVLKCYGERVVEKMSDLKETLSCILSVVTLFTKVNPKWVNDKLIAMINDHLIENIFTGMTFTQPKHFAVFSRFLLQYLNWQSDHSAAFAFSHLLMAMIPQMSVYDLLNVGTGIARNSIYALNRHPFYYLYSNLTWHVLNNSKEITNVGMLNKFTQSIFIHSPTMVKESIAFQVAELYKSFSQSLKLSDVNQTAVQLKRMRLHVPEMLQSLVDILIKYGAANVTLGNVSKVLETVSVLNFTPSGIDGIERVVVQLMERDFQLDDSLEDRMNIMAALSSLQVLPEQLLNQVFSLDFLVRLDKYRSHLSSEGNNTRSAKLGRSLFDLNRNVMFYCPQLGVPWFHAAKTETDRRLLHYSTSSEMSRWKTSVYEFLVQTLGGHKYLKKGQFVTRYNHLYDFEFALDEVKMPVAINDPQFTTHQRFAVVIITPSNFCMNRRHLIGPMLNKLNQMEMLGFKVVQIPYYDLNSMTLGDVNAKQQYFYNKVYGTSDIKEHVDANN